MYFRKLGIIIFLIFALLPISKTLAQTTNAGFVPGNIWYSKDPFAEGDKIKIYTLIFNPDTRKFSGTVDFFDNSTLLGTKDFNIAGTSTKDISISWTVTAGDHQIYGQIENAKFLTSTGAYVDASITDNKTSVSSRTVANKVVAQNISNGINAVDGTFNNALDSIQNIGNTTKNIIPSPLINTVSTTTGTLDALRANIGATMEKAKTQTQTNLTALNENKKSAQKVSELNNVTQKPFAYVALFFFTLLSAIFENKILFYSLLIIFIFLILRYFWNLFFVR
jgi:hypothetical protein